MQIVVYIESLKTFTSGMPHRGMLLELIKIRKYDNFVLVYRRNFNVFFSNYLSSLSQFSNVNLFMLPNLNSISNFLALLRFKNHCSLKRIDGDIYLNLDSHFLGKTNKPQIITVHDLSSVRSNKYTSLGFINRLSRKFIIKNGILNSNYIVSISNFTKNDIKSYYGIEKNIEVIYNGISNVWFKKLDSKIESTDSYLIWYGGFTKRKNLKNLLIAYSKLLTLNNKIPKILLIGLQKGGYFKKIYSFVKQNNILSDKVIFKSNMKDVDLVNSVRNSSGLLFPSHYEGFGLPIIEAFAMGKNVLTSNKTSMKEIASDYGILVDPDDINDIVVGLQRLILNEDHSDKLIKYAQSFTYLNCAKAYSKLVDTISENNKK